MPPLDEERAVVARLRKGEREAAGQLFAWFSDLLYRQTILPRLPVLELAEDVLKDTFRIALERIDTFQTHDRSIFFWLRRIAINRAIDVHRSRKRAQLDPGQAPTVIERTMSQQPPQPDRAPEMEDTRLAVQEALDLLNPRYAQALRMRLLEDRDREACAEDLGVSVGNFDVILHRAAKAFRKVYPP